MTERKYSKIPNEFLEVLIRTRLSGRELRYILFIARKTFGYHKAQDWIANKQFVKAMGISRENVAHIQKDLILRKIVVKNNNKLKINTNFVFWIGYKKKERLLSKTTNVVKNDNRVLSKMTPTKETITKERESVSPLIAYWLSLLKQKNLTYAKGIKDTARLAEVLQTRSADEIKEIFEAYLNRKDKIKVYSINASLSSYSLSAFDQEKAKESWQYAK